MTPSIVLMILRCEWWRMRGHSSAAIGSGADWVIRGVVHEGVVLGG